MVLPKIYNVHAVAIIATLGGCLFGFDISSMSAINVQNQYLEFFGYPVGVIQGAIGSALAAGSVVGSAVAGPLSDQFGRRDSIIVATIFWLIGTAVQVSCQNVGHLIAGRVIKGFTVGVTSSQVPVYLAEIAKRDKRGSIVIVQQLAIEFGILVMGFCHFVIGGTMGAHSYQVPEGVQGNPNIVFSVYGGAPANTVIVFSFLLIVAYALTLAPVCWIYAAEVWSLGTRATGMSLAALSNWIINFALGLFTAPGFVNIEWRLFIVFGVLCMAAATWFFLLYPETCGKTLEEIELMFSTGGPHAWQTRKGESRLEAEIEAVIARKTVDPAPETEAREISEKV